MKKNRIILIMSLLIFGLVIIYLISYKYFNHSNNVIKKVSTYVNKNYELTDSEKVYFSSRIKNNSFFDKYKNKMEQYAEVKINIDSKDGLAWGTLTLFMDKKLEEEIKKILQQTNKMVSEDSRVYGIIDDYGSIYIEKDFSNNNSEKIKLVFSVNLPYKYKSKNDYNEFVQFFLKFNN